MVFGSTGVHVKITLVTTQPRSLALVALVLTVAVLVINAPLIAGGKTWADVRYHTQVAPARMGAAKAVQSGALPGWWDGSGLGVPLAAEPSHGALYPPHWIATSTRALDLVAIFHFAWAALGIALWARRRVPSNKPAEHGFDGASEPAIVVVCVLAIASGLFASMAIRGALPAIAQLPWIGAAATWLVDARDRRARVQATIVLALALGLAGLTGVLAGLADGLVIAIAIGARRTTWRYLAAAVGAGLAISSVQWLPAMMFLGHGAGDVVHGLSPRRFLELIVPTRIEDAWAPSLFVGAGLFALAAIRTPTHRVLGVIGAFIVLALVAGRGGWHAWLGAPELHVAALVVVLAANAPHGLDDLLAGKRRALAAVLVGVACSAVALVAIGMKHGASSRALVDGGLSLACLALALVLAWRAVLQPLVFALLLLSSVSAVPSTAKTIDRDVVDEPQAFATAARKQPSIITARAAGRAAIIAAGRAAIAPRRVFRPVFMSDGPLAIDDAMGTLVDAAAARWDLAAARSEDPARLRIHDRTWLAAAREGGALLDRFGIELAILPETLVVPRKLVPIATRGSFTLAKLPVAPPASVMRGALWSADPENTLDLLYPTAGGTGVLRGTVVLEGRDKPSQHDRGPPLACVIDRWDPGAIDVLCTADAAAYAAVSSTTAAGWEVTVDGNDTEWYTADVLRRAVPIGPGTHRIAWRYTTPGLAIGLVLAGVAILGLLALYLAARASRR